MSGLDASGAPLRSELQVVSGDVVLLYSIFIRQMRLPTAAYWQQMIDLVISCENAEPWLCGMGRHPWRIVCGPTGAVGVTKPLMGVPLLGGASSSSACSLWVTQSCMSCTVCGSWCPSLFSSWFLWLGYINWAHIKHNQPNLYSAAFDVFQFT